MSSKSPTRGINDNLRIGFFILMCLGLFLASGFLWMDKIDGNQWVSICMMLFGVDRISNAVSEGVSAARSGPRVIQNDLDQ